ncbi:hypothetical protein O6H91_07G038500 [Diphasiastrum complanatum]|nr:hypothetical protein O6H91_07G038500 [Diphasiastrum complanatum]
MEEWGIYGSGAIMHSGGWVKCPVCGKSIQEKNCMINEHLDLCLSGGAKRKRVQLTMSQFGLSMGKLKHADLPMDVRRRQFEESDLRCPISFDTHQNSTMIETLSVQIEGGVSTMVLEDERVVKVKRNSFHPLSKVRLGQQDVNDGEELIFGLSSKAAVSEFQTLSEAFPKEKASPLTNFCSVPINIDSRSIDIVETKVSCYCLCHSKTWRSTLLRGESTTCQQYQDASSTEESEINSLSGCIIKEEDMLDSKRTLFSGLLETEIVGRKFHLEGACEEGMHVTVIREPDNPKDPRAIKVISLDKSDGPSLGHLPRKLAYYLSTLLDRGAIHMKGVVVTVPDEPFKAIPLKLFCESSVPEVYAESEEGTSLLGIWSNALRAGKSIVPTMDAQTVIPDVSRYQQNFITLLRTVLERDSHLFSDDEKVFLGSFSSLSGDAQRIFIHLYQRKGPWFQVNKISYKDVSDGESATEELVAARFLTDSGASEEVGKQEVFKERIQVLTVLELKQLIFAANVKKKSEVAAAKRNQLVEWAVNAAIQRHHNFASEGCRNSTFQTLLSKILGKCVRVTNTADLLIWRLQRLFFLNGEQELSSFLLVDMGRVKYPSYSCNRTRPVFLTREALLAYEQALEVAQAVDMALEVNDLQQLIFCLEKARTQLSTDETDKTACHENYHCFLQRFSAAWVYTTVCTLGVSVLERERRYVEAVELLKQLLSRRFCPRRRGYWNVRLSTNLEHLGRKEESLQVAEIGVADDKVRGGDRVALQRRVIRLGKPPRRWKKPAYAEALERKCREVQIRGRPLNSSAGAKSIFYDFEGNRCRVEELALQYYAGEGGGWKGVHSESGIWMTMFGLLMWDVLFANVADVFQTPFQTAPLDLGTDAFCPTRWPLIESRLESISQGRASDILSETWNENFGTSCRGVNWDKYSLEELQTIIHCIGGPGLSAVCKLLAEDYAGWSAGMPDLLLWRTRGTAGSGTSSCCPCNRQKEDNPEKCFDVSVDSGSLYSTIPKVTDFHNPEPNLQLQWGEAKLVEVKGPNDRLSEQQRAWILCLMNSGLSVEVCKVLERIED